MAVAPDLVRHIAKLAHLDLAEDRIGTMAEDLSQILSHMDAIAAFEVDPGVQDAGPPPKRRPDTVSPTATDHLVQRASESGEVLVPQVKDAS